LPGFLLYCSWQPVSHKTGEAFLELWGKIDKFFEKRKQFKRPKRTFAIDEDLAIGTDEARTLVFELGAKLGFDALSCERLIEIVGNPISTLKYLVAVGNEGRKLAELEAAGLLKLPVLPERLSANILNLCLEGVMHFG
jgi:hypothetical protein